MDLNEDALAQLPNPELFALMDVDCNAENTLGDAVRIVDLPPRFILVRHHRHANKPSEIVPLEASESSTITMSSTAPVQTQPWAPFQMYGDFKFAARHVQRRTPNSQINEDLEDLHDGSFSTDSLVTFHNHRDMERALAAAQVGNVPFHCETLTIEFEGIHLGGTYKVGVEFRDPWHIIMQWVSDPTLAAVSTWYSQEKYLCLNGEIDFSDPLYDEL
ncbi:hypothetical protein B0H10DRAFT_2212208 [Mycena sp. CBHHK59/15]|nr:hypothetical protein B0H10DRAFT_2212208 [Mycena sp. CBHHK59/15]